MGGEAAGLEPYLGGVYLQGAAPPRGNVQDQEEMKEMAGRQKEGSKDNKKKNCFLPVFI